MASDTNSSAGNFVHGAPFVSAIERRAALGDAVPVLVLRVPAFAQRAWRHGKASARRLERRTARAFLAAARSVLRDGDVVSHGDGCDWFAIAMLEPARAGATRATIDARAALERIAQAVVASCNVEVQTGWCHVDAGSYGARDIDAIVERALERGERERERYEFFATVGHELRTPLTSIRGYLETLLEGDVDPTTARRFLDVARREALRLARLVDGMLEFSLLDLSAAASLCAATGICEQIDAACAALEPVAAQRGIVLRSIPAGPLRGRIRDDALMHVLVNLIENAIKYGRPSGRVEVSARLREGCVEVVVDDDGPGVSPSERSRIFGIRERGNRRDAGGNGIGLAIVKTIAERSGGDVTVGTSALGGSQFVFRVPAANVAGAELRALPS